MAYLIFGIVFSLATMLILIPGLWPNFYSSIQDDGTIPESMILGTIFFVLMAGWPIWLGFGVIWLIGKALEIVMRQRLTK